MEFLSLTNLEVWDYSKTLGSKDAKNSFQTENAQMVVIQIWLNSTKPLFPCTPAAPKTLIYINFQNMTRDHLWKIQHTNFVQQMLVILLGPWINVIMMQTATSFTIMPVMISTGDIVLRSIWLITWIKIPHLKPAHGWKRVRNFPYITWFRW